MSEPTTEPTVEPTLLDVLQQRLKDAAAPLSLKELSKGLKRPAKQKAPEFEAAIVELLAGEIGSGKLFKHPSGKAGEERYWIRDEKQAIREAVLAEATTLVTLPDLVKKASTAVAKTDKGFIESVVRELLAEQKLHEYPPKKAGGQPQFGLTAPPPPPPPLIETLRERLNNASVPLSLKELAKELPNPTKQKAPEFEKSVAELLTEEISSGKLFKYASGSKGAERYWTRDEKQAIAEAVMTALETPQTSANLVKAATQATGADKAFVESIIAELIEAKRLHPQSTAAKPLYAKEPKPERNVKETVVTALLNEADSPQAEAKLVAAATKTTGAEKAFVESTVTELIQSKQLHPQSGAAKPLYGKTEPPRPHALDSASAKKAFTALVKAGTKLLEVVPGVSLDELFQRLRIALDQQPPVEQVPVTVSPVVSPAISPPPSPQPLTPERIRAGLKTAYEHLKLFREFQTGMVEIPRLYHQAKDELPELTVEQFHHQLEYLQKHHENGRVELHSLNEVQEAKEANLAIRRGDDLLYYLLWR